MRGAEGYLLGKETKERIEKLKKEVENCRSGDCVGCSNIRFLIEEIERKDRRLKDMAITIQELSEDKYIPVKIGDRFGTYMLVQVGYNTVCAIGLESANRLSEPIRVAKSSEITKEELKQILGILNEDRFKDIYRTIIRKG